MNTKVTKTFLIENESGLHARPSASIVKKASEFQSHIELCTEDGELVDGKSIMGIMCLGVGQGRKITVTATGEDAEEAVFAIGDLFHTKFGEN